MQADQFFSELSARQKYFQSSEDRSLVWRARWVIAWYNFVFPVVLPITMCVYTPTQFFSDLLIFGGDEITQTPLLHGELESDKALETVSEGTCM
jgi:hypothetical protein